MADRLLPFDNYKPIAPNELDKMKSTFISTASVAKPVRHGERGFKSRPRVMGRVHPPFDPIIFGNRVAHLPYLYTKGGGKQYTIFTNSSKVPFRNRSHTHNKNTCFSKL